MGIVWVPLTIFGGPMSLGVPENPIDGMIFQVERRKGMDVLLFKRSCQASLKIPQTWLSQQRPGLGKT